MDLPATSGLSHLNSPTSADKGINIFNKLSPVAFWEGSIKAKNLDERMLVQALEQASSKLSFNFFGFLNDGSYSFTRYPRRKYGPIPSDQRMNNALTELKRNLREKDCNSLSAQETSISNNGFKFRVVLGLEKGYRSNRFHDLATVKGLLNDEFQLTKVKIISVKDGSLYHTEPAVLIESNTLDSGTYQARLKQIMIAANQLDQERFTIEEISPRKESYIIETPKCSSPDNEAKEPLEV